MKFFRTALTLLLCLCLALPLSGCGESKSYKKEIVAMDTWMTLTAYGNKASAGLESAVGVINSLDAMLDPEKETSTVYAVNHAKGAAVVVPGQIKEMLDTATTVWERSDGALDLAIYPLVKAWGFVDGADTVPTQEQIDALLPTIDFSGVKITGFTESGDYLLTVPDGTQLTFGAVAKGCASDYAVAALKEAGVQSAIVSLGGNVQTLGLKPDGSNWSVGITDPQRTDSYLGVVSVGQTAVITSGTYWRNFQVDGVVYHHILDPKTGYPADSGLRSVTIVCDSGLTADALSTAMFVLGEEKALDYWRTYGGFEMILVTDDDRVVITSGLYDVFQSYGTNYTYEFAQK